MADDPPISAEVWKALRRFDPHCEISLVRTSPAKASPWYGKAKRVWVATIRLIDSQAYDSAQAVDPQFAEAVTEVARLAEAKGWGRG